MSLKLKVKNGLKWTSLSTIIINLLQVLQLIILARFLEPSAFGLMALVAVVIGLMKVFLDMGISNAIIHKQNITKDQLSIMYWLNILIGCMLFGIATLIAPFMAGFYKEPLLEQLIIIVSLTFIIQPFGHQFYIIWQKEMKFKEIAKIDIINKSISFIVTITLAYKGYGVFSLVFGILIGSISQTIQYMILGFKDYKPSLKFKVKEIEYFIKFGFYITGSQIINYFNSQLDSLIIGKLVGVEALGIYTIAKQIVMRPSQVINPLVTRVMFPAMSNIQENTTKLKHIYLKMINYLSSVNFPIYTFFFIMANDLVAILFGEKWMSAVPIIQVLSIYAAIRSTGNPIGTLVLAKGKVRRLFWWNFSLLIYTPIVIFIGSHYNLIGIAWGLVFFITSLIIPNWFFLVNKLCGAKFVEYHLQIIKPTFIAVLSGYIVSMLLTTVNNVTIKFLIASFVGILLILILNYLFNRAFLNELKFLSKK